MIINTNLGVHPKASVILAVLTLELESYDPDRTVDIEPRAWYNGRENGISLEVFKDYLLENRLVIVFGECRNSDSIFVDSYRRRGSMNGPTYKDEEYDAAYKTRKYFKYNEIMQATDFITNLIKDA